jgi:hypothetical protein
MKQLLQNIKDPMTDLIGLAIICFSLYEVYFENISWIWEGLTGVGVGLTLFLLPDTFITDALGKVFDKFIK